jgi:hypothetical protein
MIGIIAGAKRARDLDTASGVPARVVIPQR